MTLPNMFYLPVPKGSEELVRSLQSYLEQIARAINGGINFGDGTNIGSLLGCWVEYTSNAVPDTEDEVTHNLGQVPVGFLVLRNTLSGFVYEGDTPWTTTKLYLKCSTPNLTVKIFVVL